MNWHGGKRNRHTKDKAHELLAITAMNNTTVFSSVPWIIFLRHEFFYAENLHNSRNITTFEASNKRFYEKIQSKRSD